MEFPQVSPMSRRIAKYSPINLVSFKSTNLIELPSSVFISSVTNPNSRSSQKSFLNIQKNNKVPLPPLDLGSYSRDLNSSFMSLELEEKEPKSVPVKKSNKKRGKLEKLTFSSSVKDLKINSSCWKIVKVSKESLQNNSNFRTNSVEINHLETPTFRNLSCEFSEEFKSNLLKNNEIDNNSVHFQAKNSLLQVTSHFVSLPKDLIRNSRNSLQLREVKTVNKIKVLHHKFPKDMFDQNCSLKV